MEIPSYIIEELKEYNHIKSRYEKLTNIIDEQLYGEPEAVIGEEEIDCLHVKCGALGAYMNVLYAELNKYAMEHETEIADLVKEGLK